LTTDETIHVSFVSPDYLFGEFVGRTLGPGFELRCDASASVAVQGKDDVFLLDARDAENIAGLENVLKLMEEIKQAQVPVPVIVMTVDEDRSLTRKLIENGAYDTVASPPDIVELRLILRRAHKYHEAQCEVLQWRSQQRTAGHLFNMVDASESMTPVFDLAKKVASCDVTVLITGETGTGKSVLANAMHQLSQRAMGPFVAFSCANMPEALVEDELFGHEKGAFTGAVATRKGRFEAADHGTLFLDEIGDLPLALQAKLLRVLQERTFERLGSNTPRTTDIRLTCATHRDLAAMVKEGTFREDLYYRLNVVQIQLPALRERSDGIPLLAYHFLEQFAERFKKPVRQFSGMAVTALQEYRWPGNVRELENVVQRAVVLAEDSTIELRHLPAHLQNGFDRPQIVRSYEQAVDDFKRRLVIRTLRECDGNKAEAARVLGLARGYLHRLIHQLNIDAPGPASEKGSPASEQGTPDSLAVVKRNAAVGGL
jgi:two-component system response regulator AtoC